MKVKTSDKILIFRSDHLGDLILTTPLIRALNLSGYRVTLMVHKRFIEILENNFYVDECYAIEDIAPNFPKGWYKIAKWIKNNEYDITIYPCAIPNEIIFISLFSRVKRRIMMRGRVLGRLTGNTCLSTKYLFTQPKHFADVWLDFARILGINCIDIKPDIFLCKSEIDWANKTIKEIFRNTKKVIGIHPGHGGSTCNLDFIEYMKLVELILEEADWNIIITGNEIDKNSINTWNYDILHSKRVWISAGLLNLRQLSSVIKCMDLYIVPGTGPLHIANAVGTKTLSPLCSRIGHNENYWGNTNGKGNSITIKTEICEHRSRTCNFHDRLTAQLLYEKCWQLLDE